MTKGHFGFKISDIGSTIKMSFLKIEDGTSLMIQWLRFCISIAKDMGLISGSGTKILHADQKIE